MKLHSLRIPSAAVLVTAAVFFCACGGVAVETVEPVQIAGQTMGTYYSVKLAEPLPDDADALKQAIAAALVEVNAQMSTWDPQSELSRFNTSASTEPFAVSADTAYVVARALEIGGASGGAFDVTVGPLVNLWSFGPEARPERVPEPAELEAARAEVGGDLLETDGASHLRKDRPGVYVDLSGIAKGFGVDRIARLLDERGFISYLVDIGGEMQSRGRKAGGEPWRIAVERPTPGARAAQRTLELEDVALATSGDYRNYFEEDGVRYSHTIDPRSGAPIRHRLASVTVLAEDCTTADAWATAMMVLGEQEGYTVAEEQGLAVLMLVRAEDGTDTFEERSTPAFDARSQP